MIYFHDPRLHMKETTAEAPLPVLFTGTMNIIPLDLD